jgi:hypothetical protein
MFAVCKLQPRRGCMKTSGMLVKMRYGFRSLWRTEVEEPIKTGSESPRGGD